MRTNPALIVIKTTSVDYDGADGDADDIGVVVDEDGAKSKASVAHQYVASASSSTWS